MHFRAAVSTALALVAGTAHATTVVTAAHMLDPVKGVTVDNPVVVIGADSRVQSLDAKQFAKMVEWGMTPVEAIRAATSDAAIALNRVDDVGQLTPGHYGDIVAVAGDPTKDVRLLEHPVWVLKGGQIVTGPKP